MTTYGGAAIKEQVEAILHLNGCQQRTAGYNDYLDKRDIDMEDMERLEKITLDEILALLAQEVNKARKNELEMFIDEAPLRKGENQQMALWRAEEYLKDRLERLG